MDLIVNKMFILFQLIMIISQLSKADQRNLGLSTLTGGINPVHLLGAVKLASDASKLIPGDPKAIVDTTFKALENYSPIVLPTSSSGESTVDETIKLDDRQLKLHLSPEQVIHLIKLAGLDSKNIDWKLYRFPLSLHQLKTILATHKSSSSRLSIMSMDSYIPKIMSNLDRLSDGYYRLFEKFIESDMDLDEFMEYVEQLDQVDEGMIILPAGIKSGALAKPPGSIVLLGLGKFPADRKQTEPPSIVPTILIGSVGQVSPLQYKPIVEETVSSTSIPETVVMETPKSDPETSSSTILDVNESSVPEPGIPVAASSIISGGGDDNLGNNPTIIGSDKTSSQSFAFSSSQSSAQAQPTFFPLGPQSSSLNPPPPPQPRPMQRPPPPPPPQPLPQQTRPNLRPPHPSFDGRPSQQFQQQPNLRPIPRPRMDIQG